MKKYTQNENYSYRPGGKINKKSLNKREFGTDITVQTAQVLKLDPSEAVDPLLLGDYVGEIYKFLHSTEEIFMPSPEYLSFQEDIDEKMRGTLIDWLFEVHFQFELQEETLFLTVNILDRYLEKIKVSRQDLQLVGVTSMLIACKYEEKFFPELSDFVYITDNTYQRLDILQTEQKILKCLEFQLTAPTILSFFERYTRICKFDYYSYCIGLYLIELALLEYSFLGYKPSSVAAAAVYLSKKIVKNALGSVKKNPNHEKISSCARDLIKLLQDTDLDYCKSARKKFSKEKYHQVSKIQIQ